MVSRYEFIQIKKTKTLVSFLFLFVSCCFFCLAQCLAMHHLASLQSPYPSMCHILPSTLYYMWEQSNGSSRKPGWLCDATTLKGCNKYANSAFNLHWLNLPPVSHWASPCDRRPSPFLSSSPCTPAETGSLMQTHKRITHSAGSFKDWQA